MICPGVDENAKKRDLSFDTISEDILAESNQFVENWCEIGELIFVKVMPICLTFPPAFISCAVYITANTGKEAFALPLLLW